MLPLLAQRNGGFGPDAFGGLFIALICGILGILLVFAILFLLTLQKALARCQPRNRTMEPGMVWLNLIPLFNIVWQFITVARIAESLRLEYRSRGWHRRNENYGNTLGITSCILGLVGWIPLIGPILSLAGLVCRIIYWVKIAGYSSRLASRPYDEYDDDDDDDYDDDDDDDRPRSRRRSRDRDEDDDDDRDDDRRRNRRRDQDDDDDDRDRDRRRDRPWDRG
jgi:hypothetical protein